MQLREVAAIAGRPGLFRILKPTHGGVIVESLDATKAREAIGASQRLSILSEISMYTTTADGSEPLQNIFASIAEKHGAKPLSLSAKSDGADLEKFFAGVLPDWDSSRVYLSDIKKLVTWYNILVQVAPEMMVRIEEPQAEPAGEEEAKPEPKKAKAKKAEAVTEAPAAEAPAEEKPKKKPAAKK